MQQNWTWNETTFIPKAFMHKIFISWHSYDIAMNNQTQSNKNKWHIRGFDKQQLHQIDFN